MTKLVQLPEQIRHEFRVNANGKIIASVRGTARLADVNETGIRRSFNSGADPKPSPLAKYLIEYGFEGADLNQWIENGIPSAAVNRILLYYAHKCQPRYRSEQAEKLCDIYDGEKFYRFSNKTPN